MRHTQFFRRKMNGLGRAVLLLTLSVFGWSVTQAQRVANVSHTIEGNVIKVTYTLLDAPAGVTVHLSTDGGRTYGRALSEVTGEVGSDIKPGQRVFQVDAKKVIPSHTNLDKIKFRVDASAMLEGFDIDMVFVEGGPFSMGASSEQGEDVDKRERPVHLVRVSNFFISRYEITQKQWKIVMGDNPSTFKGDDLPVENVSWNDVQTFIERLNSKTGKNYRLPTEAEWEYAARGGKRSRTYRYAGSNNIFHVAWCWNNGNAGTYPVGQKMPNELGIHDMSGNVWEWCSDYYGEYSNTIQTNPTGPKVGPRRVLRGGSWTSYAKRCRISYRETYQPGSRYHDVGFRLVLPKK